jgi:acetoin utilization protein AcuB
MIAKHLISAQIPVLHPTDTADNALHVMSEAHLLQLPMVEGDNFKCIILEEDLLNLPQSNIPLSQTIQLLNFRPAVFETVHPFEAVRMAVQQNLNMVPVINHDEKYVGAISLENMLEYLSEHGSILEPGGIITLEIKPNDYSLSEIARICESNDITILQSGVYTNMETGMLDVTLKINRMEFSALVASFERYEYRVKEMYGESPAFENLLNRYNLLMNYINM